MYLTQGCGAFTGEMAVDQMVDMGIKCCLIGHSERRGEFGLPTPKESDELLATKCKYILEKGLMCVFAIGEPLPIREKGLEAIMAEAVIPQLTGLIEVMKGLEDKSKLVIAYEPVWAIGTGLTATPKQAQETHADIRTWLSGAAGADVADAMRIQYGGSANDKNCHDLAAGADVDGFLVGGACLAADSFGVILATFD